LVVLLLKGNGNLRNGRYSSEVTPRIRYKGWFSASVWNGHNSNWKRIGPMHFYQDKTSFFVEMTIPAFLDIHPLYYNTAYYYRGRRRRVPQNAHFGHTPLV